MNIFTFDLRLELSGSAVGVAEDGNVTWWFIRAIPTAGVDEEDDVLVVLTE